MLMKVLQELSPDIMEGKHSYLLYKLISLTRVQKALLLCAQQDSSWFGDQLVFNSMVILKFYVEKRKREKKNTKKWENEEIEWKELTKKK